MAKRRMLDITRCACLKPRTLSIALIIVVCLASAIGSARESNLRGHRSPLGHYEKWHQQSLQREPEYRLISEPADTDASNKLTDLIEHLRLSNAYGDADQAPHGDAHRSINNIQPIERFALLQSRVNFDSPSSYKLAADSANLENDPVYSRALYEAHQPSQQQLQLDAAAKYQPDQQDLDFSTLGQFYGVPEQSSVQEPTYDLRLLDLLQANQKLAHNSNLNDDGLKYADFRLDDLPPSLVDQTSQHIIGNIDNQHQRQPQSDDLSGQVSQDDTIYRLDRDSKTSDDKRAPVGSGRVAVKSTTLLEDEEDNKNKTSTDTTSSTTATPANLASATAPETNKIGNNDNSPVTTSSPSHDSSGISQANDVKPTQEIHNKDERTSSVLHRVFKKIAYYLPFLNQLEILRGSSKASNATHQHATDAPRTQSESNGNNSAQVIVLSEKRNNNNGAIYESNTKPRVSIHLNDYYGDSVATGSKQGEDEVRVDNDDNLQLKGNDVTNIGAKALIDAENQASDGRIGAAQALRVADSEDQDEAASGYGNRNSHKISLMRQSNLVMPFESNDEVVLRTTTNHEHPESLLGKYIYAPTHHYYLNTDSNSDAARVYGQVPVGARRLGANDEVYASPFSGLKSMYGAHKNDDSYSQMMLNKTNDMYFIVMVGAFCAMAMAVVLAAGLFAYRVQQNRKSNSDTDYPTYGVVGPNNMNGKCGAAALVGGYFGGPGSSAFGSKAGSTKHLPDSISGDSGVASVDKSSGKRSGTPDQQSAGTRANYMNNQNAARMYHYQHQKQQMIISDRASTRRHTSASDLDSEDENDDGSYTVYECPGLASAHEMEIKNPLFNDDRTP